jgi:Ca2+-binding EF-hand superfamily protein
MNTFMTTCFVGIAVALASVSAPIGAQTDDIPVRGPIPFAVYDKDGNGLIDEDEFTAVRAERMATRAAEGRPMRGAAGAPSFSELDTNDDEQLTKDELEAGQKAQMEKRLGMGMGQGRGMGQGMGMGRSMPAFSDFDLDGNGTILEEEFAEARNARISERAQQGYQMKNLGNAPSFADLDANGDGQISAEEFAAHQSQRHQQRVQD